MKLQFLMLYHLFNIFVTSQLTEELFISKHDKIDEINSDPLNSSKEISFVEEIPDVSFFDIDREEEVETTVDDPSFDYNNDTMDEYYQYYNLTENLDDLCFKLTHEEYQIIEENSGSLDTVEVTEESHGHDKSFTSEKVSIGKHNRELNNQPLQSIKSHQAKLIDPKTAHIKTSSDHDVTPLKQQSQYREEEANLREQSSTSSSDSSVGVNTYDNILKYIDLTVSSIYDDFMTYDHYKQDQDIDEKSSTNLESQTLANEDHSNSLSQRMLTSMRSYIHSIFDGVYDDAVDIEDQSHGLIDKAIESSTQLQTPILSSISSFVLSFTVMNKTFLRSKLETQEIHVSFVSSDQSQTSDNADQQTGVGIDNTAYDTVTHESFNKKGKINKRIEIEDNDDISDEFDVLDMDKLVISSNGMIGESQEEVDYDTRDNSIADVDYLMRSTALVDDYHHIDDDDVSFMISLWKV